MCAPVTVHTHHEHGVGFQSWFNIVDIHMSADTGSPAGLAYMAVDMDLCILEVVRPVSGLSPITKIVYSDYILSVCNF